LPIIERLVSFIVNQVVPNFQKFASAFDPIKKAINDNKDSFETLFNFIGDYVIPILTTLAGGALKVVGEVFGRIIGIIGNAIDKIEAFINKVRDMVNKVIELYNRIPLAPDLNTFGSGGGAIGGAPGAIAGGGSNAAIIAAVTGLTTVSSGITALSGATGGGGATAANKKALAKLEADAAKLGDLVDQLMGVQKVDPFGYGSFRMGEEKSMMTVNFNGIVGDGESVKRSLIELVNDSTARGTLGAAGFSR
jgi:hypothetical protein